jgi:hypothetical protein
MYLKQEQSMESVQELRLAVENKEVAMGQALCSQALDIIYRTDKQNTSLAFCLMKQCNHLFLKDSQDLPQTRDQAQHPGSLYFLLLREIQDADEKERKSLRVRSRNDWTTALLKEALETCSSSVTYKVIPREDCMLLAMQFSNSQLPQSKVVSAKPQDTEPASTFTSLQCKPLQGEPSIARSMRTNSDWGAYLKQEQSMESVQELLLAVTNKEVVGMGHALCSQALDMIYRLEKTNIDLAFCLMQQSNKGMSLKDGKGISQSREHTEYRGSLYFRLLKEIQDADKTGRKTLCIHSPDSKTTVLLKEALAQSSSRVTYTAIPRASYTSLEIRFWEASQWREWLQENPSVSTVEGIFQAIGEDNVNVALCEEALEIIADIDSANTQDVAMLLAERKKILCTTTTTTSHDKPTQPKTALRFFEITKKKEEIGRLALEEKILLEQASSAALEYATIQAEIAALEQKPVGRL